MNWIQLTSVEQLEEISINSNERPQLIFKHSSRCSISSVAKSRLDKWQPTADFDLYYLDLIRYRNISNKIEDKFGVSHESPQVLLIRNGKSVYDESHLAISVEDIIEHAA